MGDPAPPWHQLSPIPAASPALPHPGFVCPCCPGPRKGTQNPLGALNPHPSSSFSLSIRSRSPWGSRGRIRVSPPRHPKSSNLKSKQLRQWQSCRLRQSIKQQHYQGWGEPVGSLKGPGRASGDITRAGDSQWGHYLHSQSTAFLTAALFLSEFCPGCFHFSQVNSCLALRTSCTLLLSSQGLFLSAVDDARPSLQHPEGASKHSPSPFLTASFAFISFLFLFSSNFPF